MKKIGFDKTNPKDYFYKLKYICSFDMNCSHNIIYEKFFPIRFNPSENNQFCKKMFNFVPYRTLDETKCLLSNVLECICLTMNLKSIMKI